MTILAWGKKERTKRCQAGVWTSPGRLSITELNNLSTWLLYKINNLYYLRKGLWHYYPTSTILTPSQDHADDSTFGVWRGKSRFFRVTLVPNWHLKLLYNLTSQKKTAMFVWVVRRVSIPKLHAMGFANHFGILIGIWIIEVYIRGDRSSYARFGKNEVRPYKAKQSWSRKWNIRAGTSINIALHQGLENKKGVSQGTHLQVFHLSTLTLTENYAWCRSWGSSFRSEIPNYIDVWIMNSCSLKQSRITTLYQGTRVVDKFSRQLATSISTFTFSQAPRVCGEKGATVLLEDEEIGKLRPALNVSVYYKSRGQTKAIPHNRRHKCKMHNKNTSSLTDRNEGC